MKELDINAGPHFVKCSNMHKRISVKVLAERRLRNTGLEVHRNSRPTLHSVRGGGISWPILRYYSCICLQSMKRITTILS